MVFDSGSVCVCAGKGGAEPPATLSETCGEPHALSAHVLERSSEVMEAFLHFISDQTALKTGQYHTEGQAQSPGYDPQQL